MFHSKSAGKGSLVQSAHPSQQDVKPPAPGKQSLVNSQDIVDMSQASAYSRAGAAIAAREHHHDWRPPGVNEVADWLLQWTLTWTDQAGQAFDAFSTAVRADSHKSSNVGALVSMAGDGVWILGGLVANPPTEILGASLSIIGKSVHGGEGKTDDQLLLAFQRGLDNFTDHLNKGVSSRDRWAQVVKESGFRSAGSDAKAQEFVRNHLHIPNTSHVGMLRKSIETRLIAKYLHAKDAYIEREVAQTLGGDIVEDHLKGISGDVARAFANEMGINPMPTKNGKRTANPFHLDVRKKFTIIT